MWDGRETFRDAGSSFCLFGTMTCFASLTFDLADQSNSATLGHAQVTVPLMPEQRAAIVDFELGLFTAQQHDDAAGRLGVDGARGGPTFLSGVASYFGINDTLVGDYRSHSGFTPTVMTLYQGWQSYLEDSRHADPGRRRGRAPSRSPRRGAVQRQADRHPRRQGTQRRPQPDGDSRHLHDLPQHAACGQPLGAAAARHRADRHRPAHARHAALHAAQQDDRRERADDGPGQARRASCSAS